MKRFLFACGLALIAAQQAPAQSQNQTPAARQTPAKPPTTAQKPKPGDSGDDTAAPAEDAGGSEAAGEGEKQPPISFAGGELTVTQQEEYGEKVLAFDGKELARNYDVRYDRTVNVGGVDVAMVDVGDGGNQCGPAKVLVWKPEGGGDIRSLTVEQDDCAAPPAAAGAYAIYFVPFLLPGDSRPALQWAPDTGLVTSGLLSYAPEPGTGWTDVDPSQYRNIVDAFHNEAVYKTARMILGDRLTDVATSLLVGGGTETTPSGAFYASGCVPHDCGGNDGFMAVDAKKHALYFARRGEGRPDAWPPLKRWPADIRAALTKSFD